MKKEVPLTFDQYTKNFKVLSGMRIIDCYHTQDSMLRFVLTDTEGEKNMILILDGDWQLIEREKVLCDSTIEGDLTDHDFYEKLRACAAQLKKKVQYLPEILFDEKKQAATIFFDNGWRLNVQKSQFGLLSYQNDDTQEYTMYSVDMQTGMPKYYTAFP